MNGEGRSSFAELMELVAAAGSVWVVDEVGNWTREEHPVRDLSRDHETLQQRLDRLEYAPLGWKRVISGSDAVVNVKTWNRSVNGWLEYLVLTDMGGRETEYLLARSLPAYLQLRKQLREVGLL